MVSPATGFIQAEYGWFEPSQVGRLGVLLCDSNGTCLIAGGKETMGKGSCYSELVATHDGLIACKLHHVEKVEAETDAEFILRLLHRQCDPPRRIHSLLQDIFVMLADFVGCANYSYFQEKNRYANWLTNKDRSSRIPLLFQGNWLEVLT